MPSAHVLWLFLLLAGCASTPELKTEFYTQFAIKEIAPLTFVVTDTYFHDSNVLVAKMEDDTVVIASSPFETIGADLLVQWIQTKFSPKRIVAINTHFHSDGTGGNDAYLARGVEIWASDLTRKLHMEKAEYYRGREAKDFADKADLRQRIEQRKAVPAPNTFPLAKGKVFAFGEERVRVVYPGPAHAPDNVVVHLPARKVLFGGCMIKSGNSIGYLGDADLNRWESSARALLGFDVNIVIPGHGRNFGGKGLIHNSIRLAAAAARGGKK